MKLQGWIMPDNLLFRYRSTGFYFVMLQSSALKIQKKDAQVNLASFLTSNLIVTSTGFKLINIKKPYYT